MLDRLPNEILHKIFDKTNLDTAKTCRLLNNRFNTLIKTYGFHKDHLMLFRIRSADKGNGPDHHATMVIFHMERKTIFSNYEELLNALPNYLEKIGKVRRLEIRHIPINETLLNMLLQQKFLRYIRELQFSYCTFEAKNEQKWFAFLNKLHVNYLSIVAPAEESIVTFPPTILNRVREGFAHLSANANFPQLPWMTDSVALKWLAQGEILNLRRTVTGMTVQGVIECTKRIRDRGMGRCNFGILKNTSTELVEQAIREAGLPFENKEDPHFNDRKTIYRIFRERRIVATVGCIAPGPEYAHPPRDWRLLYDVLSV